jgi:hypothetical protein
MYTIEFTDLNGCKFRSGARYADRSAALELVRYYRKVHVNGGALTAVIPGGGVAKCVTLVEV